MAKTRTQPKPQDTTKVFDISSRYMAETIDVPIMDTLVDRTVDTGMRVTIKSPQSVEARDAARAFRAALALDGGELSADQVDSLFLAQLVAVTVSWSGFVNEGKDIPCTPENIRALYENPRAAWIYQQVFHAFLDTARFFGTARNS